MRNNIPVTIEYLDAFKGHPCYIYDTKSNFLTKGNFYIESGNIFLNESSDLIGYQSKRDNIILKNLNDSISDGYYIVHIMIKYADEDQYFKLTCKEANFSNLYGNLKSTEIVEMSNLDNHFKIEEATKAEYESFENQSLNFDWANIIIPPNCSGDSQADAFEDLAQDLLNHLKVQNYERISKGRDNGRDGEFEMDLAGWLPRVSAPTKWIVQCKYSKNKNNLTQSDIHTEMINILKYKPDFYLLITNRNLTEGFKDWFKNINGISNPDHIPIKRVLLQREDIEGILSEGKYQSIRKKYFK